MRTEDIETREERQLRQAACKRREHERTLRRVLGAWIKQDGGGMALRREQGR